MSGKKTDHGTGTGMLVQPIEEENRMPTDLIEEAAAQAAAEEQAEKQMIVEAATVTTTIASGAAVPGGIYRAGESFAVSPTEALRLEMDFKIQAAIDTLRAEFARSSEVAGPTDAIRASLVGGMFDCPECGLRISGPSLTAQRGTLYEHPFGESPKLGSKPCKYNGRKFKAPQVYLEPAPLTPQRR